MTAIVLTAFIGEQPRVVPRLMAANAATSAINCRLEDGALFPYRKSAIQNKDGEASWQTLHRNADEWLGWDSIVNAVAGPVATDRLYFTGDGPPKIRVDGVDHELAIPVPSGALTATLESAGSGDVTTRAYAFTYVTDLSEESEPSPASNLVDWQPGQSVTLSGFPAPPGGRVTKQRIYRSQSGVSGTYYYFIAERAVSASNFSDTVNLDGFQEVLPSLTWNAPPDDLEGLISMPNGMMAAYVDNKLYFCEPYYPHAWPEKYSLTTAAEIMGLVSIGSSLIVMTTGTPYIASGTTPESMVLTKIEQNYACINKRSVVDMGFAAAYASHEGLVTIDAGGGVALATRNIFKRSDWQKYNPATIVAGQLSGQYFAFYNTSTASGAAYRGALLIRPDGDGFLVRTDTITDAPYFDVENARLFYVEPGTGYVRLFDAENAARGQYFWRSKQFWLPRPENFSAIMVEGDSSVSAEEVAAIEEQNAANVVENLLIFSSGGLIGTLGDHDLASLTMAGDNLLEALTTNPDMISVGIYADGKLMRTVLGINKIERLPGTISARKWEITCSGNLKVERVVMATTVGEIKEAP